MKLKKLEERKKAIELLGGRTFEITDKHYGNNEKRALKTIYVNGHIFDHFQFNSLGFGIISINEKEEL